MDSNPHQEARRPVEQPCGWTAVGSRSNVDLIRVVDGDELTPLDLPAIQWVDQAIQMLESQWPRQEDGGDGGGASSSYYRDKILKEFPTHTSQYGLPCSYLLVQRQSSCLLAHGRLTECFESAGGNAAAATYIITASKYRSQGYGRLLMTMLEEEARRLGYHYVYLWTKAAIPFYQKIGYQVCQRVSLKRDCLKTLESSQVESLEALLFQKNCRARGQKINEPMRKQETILLPSKGDDDNTTPDVWMRKRLVEHVGSLQVPLSERLQELEAFIQQKESLATTSWSYHLLSLPWQAQIGPSCGIAALRMVREYFLSSTTSDKGVVQLPSLLGEAQERGYTQDGELFSAPHWMELAQSVCGLTCELHDTITLSPIRLWEALCQGHIWVLPYDSNGRTRLPSKLSGTSAHYGIVVGILYSWHTHIPEVSEHDHDKTGDRLFPLDITDSDALSHLDEKSVYLLVQHSLSSKLSIASFADFMESNQQLDKADSLKFTSVQTLDLKDRILLCRSFLSNAF